jgi:starch synthase
MIAMRYGTIPIVRKTGGLADSVHNSKTGFVFTSPSVNGLAQALNLALDTYRDAPKAFGQMRRTCANTDFSFDRSARTYLNLYRKITRNN